MDCRANSDLLFLPDEKFDFDVSLSPASSKGDEDEDEVFVGPVSHKERYVTVSMASRLEVAGNGSGGGVRVSWSPLTGDQLEAVCQEAHRLATQLQSGVPSQPLGEGEGDDSADMTVDTTSYSEEFVEDTEAKMDALDRATNSLSPIKRQTFCVQDSPMKQLPPAIQRRLLRETSAHVASSTRPTATNKPSSTRLSARVSTSSPVMGAKVQPRTAFRGKAALGVGGVLPSKPAAPSTSCSASKGRGEKTTRLQPPSKQGVGVRRQSPVSRPSSRAESCEDLLSDSASVASDVSDSSLNSSLLGRRILAPPTKSVVRNLSGVKAQPLQSRRVTDRKNTSSSSSSVSSFNSSMSLSPAKGKLNSSLNRSLSGSTNGAAPGSISRPAGHRGPRRSTAYAPAEKTSASSSAGRRCSLTAQARKLSEGEHSKGPRSTPLKRAETTTLQLTPSKRVSGRPGPVPPAATAQSQSRLKAKPRPEAEVVPTPSIGVRGVQHGNDVSKTMKPKRLVSATGLDSLHQKPSAGPLTPSAGGCRSLQTKARRPSALPTPVKRRTSAIPTPTPTNRARAQVPMPPPTSDTDPTPGSAKTVSGCSPAPADSQEVRPANVPDIQPFCLEEEGPPGAPPCGAPRPAQSESTDPGAPALGQLGPVRNLIELETEEEINVKTQEVLLLDLPAPTLLPQEKLLIDLTNTPDLIRTSSKTCTSTQLIDLSSPLIKWSPEDKRENNAPLINLSF